MCGNANLSMARLFMVACCSLAIGYPAGCGGNSNDDSATSTVNASVKDGGGSVEPRSQNIHPGETASINIQPDDGYYIASITDNGEQMAIATPYIIAEVSEDHDVEVIFEEEAADSVPTESTGLCPDEAEAFACAIASEVAYSQFAWEDSGTINITVSPTIFPDIAPISDIECGVSGEGDLALSGEGPGYTCSGNNHLEVTGYCSNGKVYLSVMVTSNGTITAGLSVNTFSNSYAYELDFTIETARSGQCVVTVPVAEGGSTTWTINPAG